jgi:hypothetical protein
MWVDKWDSSGVMKDHIDSRLRNKLNRGYFIVVLQLSHLSGIRMLPLKIVLDYSMSSPLPSPKPNLNQEPSHIYEGEEELKVSKFEPKVPRTCEGETPYPKYAGDNETKN